MHRRFGAALSALLLALPAVAGDTAAPAHWTLADLDSVSIDFGNVVHEVKQENDAMNRIDIEKEVTIDGKSERVQCRISFKRDIGRKFVLNRRVTFPRVDIRSYSGKTKYHDGTAAMQEELGADLTPVGAGRTAVLYFTADDPKVKGMACFTHHYVERDTDYDRGNRWTPTYYDVVKMSVASFEKVFEKTKGANSSAKVLLGERHLGRAHGQCAPGEACAMGGSLRDVTHL